VRTSVDRTHAYRVKFSDGFEAAIHHDQLLTIKRGEMRFAEADAWRKELQHDFESAFQTSTLPDRPDYERANAFLVDNRRRAIQSELP